MSLLTRASTRYLWRHRAQLVLSVVGVALGVAVVLAIDLATESARQGFRVSAETVSGRATHRITGDAGFLDETVLTGLRVDLGLRASAPVVEGFAASDRLPGMALRVLGVDPFSEGPFRPFVAGGAAGFAADGAAGVDIGSFVTTPRGVVMAARTAESAGVGPGDSLPVLVEGVRWSLPVVGVLEPTERLTREGLTDILLMDIAGAQELLGASGRLSHIDLLLPESGAGTERLRLIEAALPPGASVAPVGTRTEAMAGMIDAFELNLTALSLLALIFGTFLIYNAVTFSVVQRRDLFGRLRTMGVSRAELLGVVLREAAWIGLAGAAVGLALGIVLARGLVRLVTRTINDLYFTVAVEGVALDPVLLAKAGALGLGATLLAALPPALEAARAEPRLTTLRSVFEESARRLVPRAALVGIVFMVVGGAFLGFSSRSLSASFTALFFVVSGLALLTPAGTVLLVRASRPLLRSGGGLVGVMAGRGILTSLGRTAPAVAALVVAVSVTVGLGVMIQSFRGSVVRWLDGTLRADIYVSLPGPRTSLATGTLDPEIVASFVAHSGVVAHSTYRAVDLLEAVGGYRLVALQLDPRGESAFDFQGGDADEIMARFQAGEGILASEPFAFRRELAPGDELTVPTPAGPTSVPILGVFRDYGSDQGTVMMSRRLYDRYFEDPEITSLALFLSPGSQSEVVVDELLALVPAGRTVIARSNDTLREASLEVFDRTFEVTVVLRMLAFIVAFVGVLSALMALELERSRELGVMRAWGLTPGELRRLVLTQTGLLGLVSGVLAVPVGVVLSVVMIHFVNRRSFGWTLEMQLGPEVLVQAVALALVGALLAGVYPAWRMSRTAPALALRGE